MSIPTVEESMQYARDVMCISEEVAEAWWLERSGVGWKFKGQPITNWQDNLKGFNIRWKANRNQDRTTSSVPKPEVAVPTWVRKQALEKELERVQGRLDCLTPQCKGLPNYESRTAERKQLIEEKKTIVAKLGEINRAEAGLDPIRMPQDAPEEGGCGPSPLV